MHRVVNFAIPGLATVLLCLKIYNLWVTRFFNLYRDGRVNLRVRADFQNAFNNVNYQSPPTVVTTTGFGTISAAYPARAIQLGAKVTF